MEFPMIIGGEEVNSVRELRALAENNTEAQMILGDAFWDGDGVPQDFRKAYALFEKAANNDNSQALLNIGFMHRKGIACNVDLLKTEKCYLKAAELGDEEAYSILAEVYIYGMGPVKQDLKKGFDYAYKAVEVGNGAEEVLEWFGGRDTFEEMYELITEDLLDDYQYHALAQRLREDQSPEYLKYEPAGLYD